MWPMTTYGIETLSTGKPWYPGSNKYWSKFNVPIARLAKGKRFKGYVIYLYKAEFTYKGSSYFEYKWDYYSTTEGKNVTRDYIRAVINYKKDFEEMIR